jgi:acyl-CoA thioester hydrolase
MAWDYPNPFTLPAVPQVDDIDGLNHTNNAVYVQWCEKIGWAHSEALGLSLADYQRLDRAMAIRRGEYDYILPTAHNDKLTLATWLTSCDGKLTMERRFQLIRDTDQATVLRGRWELVCIELSSGRARRIPSQFSQVYLAAMVGPAITHAGSLQVGNSDRQQSDVKDADASNKPDHSSPSEVLTNHSVAALSSAGTAGR